MAIAHDVTTTAVAYTSTGTQTTSHVASASAKGAVVLIDQNASVTDEVSGVTYGGVAMQRYSFNTESAENGAVYIYWLDNIPTGTQNVAMTTTANRNKQLSVSTMTTASGLGIVPVGAGGTGTSTSAANPTWTTTGLTAGVATQAYEVIHSGLDTMTTTPATGWTLISSTDLGSQGRGFARLFTASSGTSLTAGWIAATADDYVGASIVFVEAVEGDVSSPFTATLNATVIQGEKAQSSLTTTATRNAVVTVDKLIAASRTITATLSATALVNRFADVVRNTTATLSSNAKSKQSLDASNQTTFTVTATALVSLSAATSTTITADLTATVVKPPALAAVDIVITTTLSAVATVNKTASTSTNITGTLTVDASASATALVNTQTTVGLTADADKTFLLSTTLAVSASISTTATRSNPATDSDIDVTVSLEDAPWDVYLDEQPWYIINGVSILEATLDPAVQTYASLDIDSNYYTLEYNLWEVTL